MRTIKLVILGDSGVGKTSLRGQYILGHFSNGYRSTIGTDFITKTLPHYSDPDESVTLQIWDTAGQERFSSLSSAFFRGADAALLMFDVTRPETLAGLTRWWAEFCACAPVRDEDARDYCVVVVGNKLDLAEDAEVGVGAGVDGGVAEIERPRVGVTEAEAERFLEELVPRGSTSSDDGLGYGDDDDDGDGDERGAAGGSADDPFVVQDGGTLGGRTSGLFLRSSLSGFSLHSVRPKVHSPTPNTADDDSGSEDDSPQRPRTQNISIHRLRGGNGWSAHGPRVSKSHASDRSQFGGTMSTTRTAQTLFHTPASSIFGTEAFESAPSSPLLSYVSVNSRSHSHARPRRSRSRSQSYDRSSFHKSPSRSPSSPTTPGARAVRRAASVSSSSSAPTITPSLFLRTQPSTSTSAALTPPTPPEADDNDTAHFPFTHSRRRAHAATSQPSSASAQSSRPPPAGLPPRPERGPRLFLASAKTGAGVAPVFEYIAQRVVRRWEYAEAREGVGSGRGAARVDMLRLVDMRRTGGGRGWAPGGVSCCGT